MSTLTAKTTKAVRAAGVRFMGDKLRIRLDDGREISLNYTTVPWLKWLANATPKQRANCSIEPGGYAIHWDDLDDGIEVCHLLDSRPIA